MSRDDRIYLDHPDTEPVSHPARRVGHCTCGTWDHTHELHCGWDIADTIEVPPVPSGPIAAMPYAAVPTTPAAGLAGPDMHYGDLIVLVDWMAKEAGFEADDIAEAVRKPWKYADELAEAREWMTEQIAAMARRAS